MSNAAGAQQPQTEKKRPPGHDMADDQESTDVSKAGDGFSPAIGVGKAGARESLQQSALYDWSEVAYLFEDGLIPQELL